MRNLTLLFILFILLDRIGLLINVLVMNPETTTIPTNVRELREAFGFMLIFAFWYWIILYSGWIIANLLLFFFFGHSIVRSIDALSAYLYDGNLLIDNNQIENSIRPLALGRKNYLFAGSHEAAQRAAMIYSFFAICKKHNINPYNWLKNILINISTINHKNITDLYPQNFNKVQQLTICSS